LLEVGGRDNFYSVVYPIATPLYDQLNMKAMKVANALKIAPVAFYPAYYEKEEDADLRDIAHMVINNIKTDQPYRFHPTPARQLYPEPQAFAGSLDGILETHGCRGY
jgi:DNA polymerase-3 subunit alpha